MSTDPLITQPIFRFKPNDFCVFTAGLEICNNQNIQQASKTVATTNVQKTITDSEYTLSITIQSQTTMYSFIIISNTKIEYVLPTNGLPNASLAKQ